MIEKIYDTESIGYASFCFKDKSTEQVFLVATTPENLANCLGNYISGVEKITVVDMCDRLILEASEESIIYCRDADLCGKINCLLASIQAGEKEAGMVLKAERETILEYLAMEEENVMRAECRMI